MTAIAKVKAPTLKGLKFVGWSPSKLDDYNQCPRWAAYKHLLKLCTSCHRGAMRGKFGEPQVCDTCGVTYQMPKPLARGGEIGRTLENYVNGTGKKLHPEIRHPDVIQLAMNLRKDFKKKLVQVEHGVVCDEKFRPVSQFTKGAWLRTKLDVRQLTGKIARVIDWKTGGVDKDTGEVKAQAKYDDQILSYQVVTLHELPQIEEATGELVFTDCAPRFSPVVTRDPLKRKDLPKAEAKLRKLVKPMLADTTFCTRPSYRCGYCDYGKKKGGPCDF